MGLLLSSPITTKDSADGGNDKVKFGCSAMQGWRTGMEGVFSLFALFCCCCKRVVVEYLSLTLSSDAHSCQPSLDATSSFFAVFDGHGGATFSDTITLVSL